MWVAFLKEKSYVFQHFKSFKNLAESESEEKVKCLRIDRGGEFNSEDFKVYCEENRIKDTLLLLTHHNRMEWWKGRIG